MFGLAWRLRPVFRRLVLGSVAPEAAFQVAIAINPNYPEAHYNLGSILFRENQLAEALAAFRQAAEANSDYANAYYAAGLVFMRQQQYADAQQVLQYAKDLYATQGNAEWEAKATEQLQRLQQLSGRG